MRVAPALPIGATSARGQQVTRVVIRELMLARFGPEHELNTFIVNVTTAAWTQQTGSRAAHYVVRTGVSDSWPAVGSNSARSKDDPGWPSIKLTKGNDADIEFRETIVVVEVITLRVGYSVHLV